MVVKTIFMIALYSTPFLLILTGAVTNLWLVFGLYIIMGFGMAGIGLSIMHDANHGSYSNNKAINKYLGLIINVVGGHATNWKIQHNVLHHSFTNVEGLDDDINPGSVMRFSPHSPHRKFHKFQHLYAWFLYGFMTLSWITVKDFKLLIKYRDMGLLIGQGTTFARELTQLILYKLAYYVYVLILPLIFSSVAPWVLIVGLVVCHYVAGMTLALIFQPAHVMEHNDFPLPDDNSNIENHWAVHQLHTTANFAPKNGILYWYCGGLNYQVEHHLFPTICHVHYRKLSKIVKETAREFNLPYHSQPSFLKAIWVHGQMLKELGKPEPVLAA
jgi:linoleoyl-CoA desaturase